MYSYNNCHNQNIENVPSCHLCNQSPLQPLPQATTGLIFFFFFFNFMAVLGLRFCARAFSSCGERGPLFIAVRGPLTIAASRCGAQAPDAQAQ